MKKILTAICVAATTLTACNDNFLEKYPLTDLTEENAFKEYDNFKAFVNPCYEMFTNTTIHTSINNSYMNAQFYGDWYGGLVTHRDNARNPICLSNHYGNSRWRRMGLLLYPSSEHYVESS